MNDLDETMKEMTDVTLRVFWQRRLGRPVGDDERAALTREAAKRGRRQFERESGIA